MEAAIILGLVTLQRLGELMLSNRNTRRLLAAGATEKAPGHYPLIVAVHAFWLAGLWVLAPGRPVSLGLIAAYAAVQVLRVWVITSLGPRWTTRIIVLPGAPLVRRGPYRFLAHPNYVVVALEIALLPLAFGLVGFAVLFSVLDAIVLFVRIREENAALGRTSGAHRREVPG